MKVKYMLRGLGVGIIITAVVMTAYTRKAVADARVKVLKEYGIGEEAKIVETFDDTEVIPFGDDRMPQTQAPGEESAAPDGDPARETQTQANPEPESAETPSSDKPEGDLGSEAADNKPADSKPAENENAGEQKSVIVVEPEKDKDTITIVISTGDDSSTVARKLQNAGLVDKAAEFDDFLVQKHYDKKINTGTKTLKRTDTWKELAEKITK